MDGRIHGFLEAVGHDRGLELIGVVELGLDPASLRGRELGGGELLGVLGVLLG